MAYKFITEADFNFKIRTEILSILKGVDDPATKMEAAENTALAQVRQYIGSRYDVADAFAKAGADRDGYLIKVVIIIMLYDLYGQTGSKDIPEHRKEDYGDIMKWLDKVGDGRIPADLPVLGNDVNPGEIRMNSKTQENWDY